MPVLTRRYARTTIKITKVGSIGIIRCISRSPEKAKISGQTYEVTSAFSWRSISAADEDRTAVSIYRIANGGELRKNPYSCADSVYPLFFVRSGQTTDTVKYPNGNLWIGIGIYNWSSYVSSKNSDVHWFETLYSGSYPSYSDSNRYWGFPLRCLAIE